MLVTILALFLFIQLLYLISYKRNFNTKSINDILSFIIFLFLIVLFFFRNEDFGADTQNYLNEFDEYCSNPSGYIG
ncbi:TPA: O-antigen polymerase, partial [Escherichia coli]|nr:O-antigen polymerase [Escherichia coli]